jgi:hypothetical protein
LIAERDDYFKFDGMVKLIAYVLDKYNDGRFEKIAE